MQRTLPNQVESWQGRKPGSRYRDGFIFILALAKEWPSIVGEFYAGMSKPLKFLRGREILLIASKNSSVSYRLNTEYRRKIFEGIERVDPGLEVRDLRYQLLSGETESEFDEEVAVAKRRAASKERAQQKEQQKVKDAALGMMERNRKHREAQEAKDKVRMEAIAARNADDERRV